MFAAADAVVLNKADLLAYFDFDLDYFRRGLAMVNPDAPLFVVSCRTGEGMDEWVSWLVNRCKAEALKLELEARGFWRPMHRRNERSVASGSRSTARCRGSASGRSSTGWPRSLGLHGWVINDTAGRVHRGRGPPRPRSTASWTASRPRRPPRAIIQSLSSAWLPRSATRDFEIRHSDGTGAKTALVLPDIATCPDCLAEDARSRRPPLSLPVHQLHQLRPALHASSKRCPTTGRTPPCAGSPCAPRARASTTDPLDRRFHAQPNACPVCGPRLALFGRMTKDERQIDDTPTSSVAIVLASTSRVTKPSARRRAAARGQDRGGQGAGRLSPDGGCAQRRGDQPAARAQAPPGEAVRRHGARSRSGRPVMRSVRRRPAPC